MLRNERYIGRIPFGEFKKVYRGGTKKREKQSEYLKIVREDLRIIEQPLWEKTQERIKATREKYIRDTDGALWGKPDNGRHSNYLLSGFVIHFCGGTMVVTTTFSGSSRGKRKKEHKYVCSYNHNRGESVCSHRLKIRLAELDTMVLDAIRDTVLNPENIRYVIKKAMEEVARLQMENPDRGENLKEELRKTEQEQRNLVSAIASGNAPKIILQEIKAKESKIEALKTEVARYTAPAQMSDLDFEKLERDLAGRLEKFTELINSDIPVARQALRKLFKKPLVLKPTADGGYILEGSTSLGALFPANINLASPRGFEPRSPP